jgi:LPXTG-motif cell wall-anchored protein
VKRQVTMAVIACLAMSALVAFSPTSAGAQKAQAVPCFPGGGSGDYPPSGPAIEPSLRLDLITGLLVPSTATGTLTVVGAIPNLTYCGTLFSTPVTLTPRASDASGVLHFDGLTIPSDFKLNSPHHLDVYRQARLVGAFDFCVNGSGHLTALNGGNCASSISGSVPTNTKPGGSLPRTGWDHLVQILKIAALVIALGVFLLYVRRRRAASVLQA